MISDLTPALVLAVIGLTMYKIVELFARRKERLELIQKLSGNNTNLNANLSFNNSNPFSSLKIGLLLVGVGLGCLIGIIIQTTCTDSLSFQFDKLNEGVRENIDELVGTIYFACISTFGGIGLVTAYLIERKDRKK